MYRLTKYLFLKEKKDKAFGPKRSDLTSNLIAFTSQNGGNSVSSINYNFTTKKLEAIEHDDYKVQKKK